MRINQLHVFGFKMNFQFLIGTYIIHMLRLSVHTEIYGHKNMIQKYFWWGFIWILDKFQFWIGSYICFSMTSLLTHTFAHSTRPSFRLKTNNQPLKKFLSLAVSWVKVVKNGKILTFKVNFLCQKLSESF